MIVDKTILAGKYDALRVRIRCGNSPLSFRTGKLFEQEGYKYGVFRRGHSIFEALPWDDPFILQDDRIMDATYQAIRITYNLIEPRDIMAFTGLKESSVATFKQAMVMLWREDRDAEAFEVMCKSIGRRYPLISYLFFLKDSTKYAVMRPRHFKKRLPMVGAPKDCTDRCTWVNYSDFLAILDEVRDFLSERVNEPITRLEAHTFIWSMWMLEGGDSL